MSKPNFAQWRVLVVDDEQDSIDVVRMVLTAAGARVYEAHDGREGLAVFEREQPTLVLADISMPEMDGREMLKGIRAASQDGHHTPVIALTAHAMVGDRESLLAEGFDGYMSKPLKMFTFLDDLSDCLNGIG